MVLCLSGSLGLLGACHKDAAPDAATPTSASVTPVPSSATTSADLGTTGLKECDDVMVTVQACLSATRGKPVANAASDSFEQYRLTILGMKKALTSKEDGALHPKEADMIRQTCVDLRAKFLTTYPECAK
jgi:hypothetical protein